MRAFKISEKDLDSECRELRVEGELDLSVADQFEKRLEAASKENVDVLVRLDQCEFIDSTGIAAIVWAHKLLAAKGRRLRLSNPSGQVNRVLDVTGLSDNGLVFARSGAAPGEQEASS